LIVTDENYKHSLYEIHLTYIPQTAASPRKVQIASNIGPFNVCEKPQNRKLSSQTKNYWLTTTDSVDYCQRRIGTTRDPRKPTYLAANGSAFPAP
jgi:hypothetical protein